MNLFREALLLFCLNLLDALLTIIWVRNGVAHEANGLMATLLDMGDFSFLAVKLAIGLFAALAFLRGAETKIARYGITLALALYLGLMGIHIVTGLSGIGLVSEATFDQVRDLALAVFIA